MPQLDLFQAHATALLHQVDKSQVARAEDHNLLARDFVVGTQALLWPSGPFRKCISDCVVGFVTACDPRNVARVDRRANQAGKSVALALFEGGALRLAMVRE